MVVVVLIKLAKGKKKMIEESEKMKGPKIENKITMQQWVKSPVQCLQYSR